MPRASYYDVFPYSKLEIALAIPASDDEKH